jgi:hypothetical protein
MPSFLTYETFKARYFPEELINMTLAHVERHGHEIDSCVLLALEEEIKSAYWRYVLTHGEGIRAV